MTMPSSPREMMEAVVANLPAKTGKSLEQWVAIIKKSGPSGTKERVQWLKDTHKLGHITAQIVVANAEGRGDIYENEEKLVEGLFGTNSTPRDIYQAILRAVKSLKDVKVRPCKTYVPFACRRQFALAKPAKPAGVDLQLALDKDVRPNHRLVRIKSRDRRMSHVVTLTSPKEVDGELRQWLKQAYDAAC
jgi:hypothetical protein